LAATTGLCEKPLCDEHRGQFFDVEEHYGQMEEDTTSAQSAVISEIIDLYQRSGAESHWGGNKRDGARRPDLDSRTSCSASWESDDVELEWDARAFDSKLCW